MNGFLHQITAHPGWPILPIGMVVITWLGVCLRLSMTDAGGARRTLGRGLGRFMAIPDAELDREIETAMHSIAFLAIAIVPACAVAAFFTGMMVVGTGIHDANVSSEARIALYVGVAAACAIGIPAFLDWFVRTVLARSLDRRFARRTLTP